jgi:hypothetical protein
MAFDSDLAPIVGQQITLTSTNSAAVTPQINLLIQRAQAAFVSKILGGTTTECDLIAKLVIEGAVPADDEQRGAVFLGGTSWQTDRDAQTLTTSALLALAATPGQEVTFTCVPPGSGLRMGVDRDEDGFLDRDELDAGSDPADPASTPGGTTTTTVTTTSSTSSTTSSTLPGGPVVNVQTTALRLRDDNVPPANLNNRRVRFRSQTRLDPQANRVVVPAVGGAGDPTLNGGTLIVYNAASGGDIAIVLLPSGRWERLGTLASPKGYLYTDPDRSAPIRRVRVTADRIAVRGGRENWTYTLDESSQGSVGVRLLLGSGVTWCAQGGQPGFPPRRDERDRFIAARRTPPPPVCPLTPGGSPSGAFLDVEAAF